MLNSASPGLHPHRNGKPLLEIVAGVPSRKPLDIALIRRGANPERVDPVANRIASPKQKSRDQDLAVNEVIRQKMTLLGLAAHDLRQPIATILSYTALLAESVDRTACPEQMEMIDTLNSVGKFMLDLLDDTLDFAALESGTIRVCPELGTVASIVRQSVLTNRPLAERKGMYLRLVEEGPPRPVFVDPTGLRRVFNNLIENAIKYCQPGADIEVKISRSSKEVVATVSDNGPGIAPADFKSLFTPFQATFARALSEDRGAGLGLAVAKIITELHGGRITAKSEIGHGATFEVSLPVGLPPASK